MNSEKPRKKYDKEFKREVVILKREREILKKATDFFAKNQ
jgi:transposase-like protein